MDNDKTFLKKIGCTTKRLLFVPCLIILLITVSNICHFYLYRTAVTVLPTFNQPKSKGDRNVHGGVFRLSAGSNQIAVQQFSDYWKKVDFKYVKRRPLRNQPSPTRFDDSLSTTIQTQTEPASAPSIGKQIQSYVRKGNSKDVISWRSQFKLDNSQMKTKTTLLSFDERRSLMKNTLPYNAKDVDLITVKPFPYIKSYKNPCWLETYVGPNYTKNVYTSRQDVRQELSIMTEIFHKRQEIGDFHRVRCLPYFLIIGQPKSGSTDLYRKIIAHPEVRNIPAKLKEPHWWARARLGRSGARGHVVSLESYIDVFDLVSYQIEMDTNLDDTGNLFHHLVTGEGSMSTFWDNDHWWAMVGNENITEPRILIPDYIHHLLPDVKLILILRNPTTRMYSDFLYFRKNRKAPGDFHEAVVQAVRLYQDCIHNQTVRSCVYNYFLNFKAQIRLRVGLYSVFLKDWLRLFPREQIFIIRTEDYGIDPRAVLRDLFHFMELRKLTSEEEDIIASLERANTRRKVDLKYGDMLPQTRALLDTFYKPFNEELAHILNDESFLWQDQL